MPDSGFFYDELTDFNKEMMDLAEKGFPAETDTFLRREGRKLTALQKRTAKQDTGTSKGKKKDWKKETSYMSGFKTGKIYKTSDGKKVSAYNKARHGHLVEYGHKTKNGKYVHGRYVIASASNEFKHIFENDCEKFTDDLFTGKFK